MSQSKRILLAVVLIAVLDFAFPASATINVVSDWRLGEADSGGIAGAAAVTAADSVGLNNLSFHGTASYSSDVSFQAAAETGSSLSVNFANNAFATNTIVSSASDNFGIEAWVKPESSAGGVIVYNGNTATSGWGISIGSGDYNALYGGVQVFGSLPVTNGVWTHVALVCAGGTSTLYINGISAGTFIGTPHTPVGNFGLACPPQAPTSQFFTGLIDEVRVFTFATGQFSTADLLINSPLESATTTAATRATATSATLNGVIAPRTLATAGWLDWGLTTGYGHSNSPVSVGNGTLPVAISNNITGLQAGRVYHFRASETNSAGFARGWDKSFVTPVLSIPGGASLTTYVRVPFTNSAILTASPLAISANDSPNGMALKADGTVVVWGDNSFGQTNVPAGLSNVVSIAVGNFHCAALKRDGTVVAWGEGDHGETNVPAGLNNVVAIAAGGYGTFAVRGDGTVAQWGSGFYFPLPLTNIVQVSASLGNSVALTADGKVISSYVGATPPNATNIVSVAAGSYHVLALRADGTVVAWGMNNAGQTNVPANVTNVMAIAATGDGSMALLSNGTVVAWGSDDGNKDNVPSSVTNAVAIAAAGAANFAMRADGTVIGWGSSAQNQTSVPGGLTNITGAVSISGSVNINQPGLYPVTYTTTNFLGAVNSDAASVSVVVPALTNLSTNPNALFLAWPSNAAGYTLQESSNLQSPAWVSSPSGATNPVSLPTTNSVRFYRLSHE
jgi:alpha-tubulin suppressor-like RCC1 family protein